MQYAFILRNKDTRYTIYLPCKDTNKMMPYTLAYLKNLKFDDQTKEHANIGYVFCFDTSKHKVQSKTVRTDQIYWFDKCFEKRVYNSFSMYRSVHPLCNDLHMTELISGHEMLLYGTGHEDNKSLETSLGRVSTLETKPFCSSQCVSLLDAMMNMMQTLSKTIYDVDTFPCEVKLLFLPCGTNYMLTPSVSTALIPIESEDAIVLKMSSGHKSICVEKIRKHYIYLTVSDKIESDNLVIENTSKSNVRVLYLKVDTNKLRKRNNVAQLLSNDKTSKRTKIDRSATRSVD